MLGHHMICMQNSVKNKFFTREFVPVQGAKAPVKFAVAGTGMVISVKMKKSSRRI